MLASRCGWRLVFMQFWASAGQSTPSGNFPGAGLRIAAANVGVYLQIVAAAARAWRMEPHSTLVPDDRRRRAGSASAHVQVFPRCILHSPHCSLLLLLVRIPAQPNSSPHQRPSVQTRLDLSYQPLRSVRADSKSPFRSRLRPTHRGPHLPDSVQPSPSYMTRAHKN